MSTGEVIAIIAIVVAGAAWVSWCMYQLGEAQGFLRCSRDHTRPALDGWGDSIEATKQAHEGWRRALDGWDAAVQELKAANAERDADAL